MQSAFDADCSIYVKGKVIRIEKRNVAGHYLGTGRYLN